MRLPGFRHRSGLTLVELAMVILIMAVLFSVMVGVFFRASTIAEEASPPAQRRQRALLAMENIRTAINNTYYMADIERLVFFARSRQQGAGHRDQLTLASVIPGAEESGTPEVREVSFYLEPTVDPQTGAQLQDQTFTLYRREDQNVDEFPGQGGAHYPLVDGVVSLKYQFSYNAKTWYPEWNTKKTSPLPRLIQIEMIVKVGTAEERFETLASPGLYIN